MQNQYKEITREGIRYILQEDRAVLDSCEEINGEVIIPDEIEGADSVRLRLTFTGVKSPV